MNKEKENKKSRYTNKQIVLDIAGIIILLVGLIAGYNIMSMKSVIPTNAVDNIPGTFYTYFGLFVISIGFFAGLSLWGIAHLNDTQMKKNLND